MFSFFPEATPENVNFVLNAFNLLCYLVVGLIFVATVLVRLVAKSRTSDVDKIASKMLNMLHFLPTFGKNPRTKAMEDVIRSIIDQKQEVPAEPKIEEKEFHPKQDKQNG